MIKEKIQQAVFILNEQDVDLWITFVRETVSIADPVLPLILGTGCTWQSAFMISSRGDTIAIVGNLDAENIKRTGAYADVISYTASIRDALIEILNKLAPKTIAINYSKNDYMSDGLSHGMYLLLTDYLAGTGYENKLVSSEKIVSALRGRKSQTEIERIRNAIRITEEIWESANDFLAPGLREKEIAGFIQKQMRKYQVEPAWDAEMCPSVFTGPDTAGAHYGPTDRKTERGHIINMDFGVKKDGYCSDLQRTWYFLKEHEKEAPEQVNNGFITVRIAIQKAKESLKPGVEAWTIDKIARDHIVDAGFEEYPHGLGHQVGRLAHDGGVLLGPLWERYGDLPRQKIEAGQVFTLEPRVTVAEYGVATIEEMVVVTESGSEFLSYPQDNLWLIR